MSKENSPQKPKKCSYKDGPCRLMAEFSHPGNSPQGKGIFAMSNVVNMNNLGKVYHKGFFFRSDCTEKNGVMLNFCPWCGADLGKWLSEFYDEFDADDAAWKKANPHAEEKRAKKEARFKKERQEFLDGLEPEIKTVLTNLSEKQREALNEAWTEDGRFLNGSGVHHKTIESICNPDRGLVSKGRKLNTFGIKVREAAQEFFL